MSERRKVLELFEQQKDYIEERLNYGIENYRKTNATIILKDKDGNLVKNAKIAVKLTKHEFKYGTNLFMLDELETKEKNDLYKKHMSSFGNIATLPFYWNANEPQKGNTRYKKGSERIYRRPPIDLCLEFCEEHGIEPREHGLAYENFFPEWLYGASVEDIKKHLKKRCKEISALYANKIPTIEVTNEMSWAEGKTAFYDAPDYVEWCFKIAEEYFPNNQLVINEMSGLAWCDRCRATDKYYAYIEANMLKGARIDAIGMQFHQFAKRENEYNETRAYFNPKNLYKHMDLYSNFKKPLQITEITVPSYSWEPEDEAIQAEIIEYLYKIWFSHASVEQIIYWNLVDGYAHVWAQNPEEIRKIQGNMTVGENYYYGGLLRFDLSPKPAYYVIKNLFEKVWHTEEELVLDGDGKAEFKGFYGDYEAIIDGETYNFSLKKNNENIFSITLN